MFNARNLVFVLYSAVACGYASPVWAQDIAVDRGTVLATFAAFECSVLAELSDYPDEAQRFLEIGYRTGLEVDTALEEGLVTREQLHVPPPALNLLVYRGPNADFVLGRYYQLAHARIYDEIARSGLLPGTKARRQEAARTLYLGRNCPGILLHHTITATTPESTEP